MTISITGGQWYEMQNILAQSPADVFLSWQCRQYIAKDRWRKNPKNLEVHKDTSPGVMPGTVAHNSTEVATDTFGSARRSQRLLNPLSALDPVYSCANELQVLSVGPRTEMELFHLMAIGFRPENIKALDLISSSPMIDTGDMHAMPYPDRTFDVVISSWVLNYSSTPQVAVDEMLRVCKTNALLAIGVTYAPNRGTGTAITDPGATKIIGSMQRMAQDLADMLKDHIAETHFTASQAVDKQGPVMLIVRVK
ncbi:Methyltransferase type 11 [uncultured Caudovirales phage]|uniref:Methyltransferase type 11 n=1 Tax=uncultured Caudovirales phage TaxID=2100421 RepID=A0A6J5RWF9_9CAUD|nr:Methyltransferase type 11 [uncultured Caudovirales phage]CAB4220729.1 Methyltransferase type 11 [uncultured Caudovirales phage]